VQAAGAVAAAAASRRLWPAGSQWGLSFACVVASNYPRLFSTFISPASHQLLVRKRWKSVANWGQI